MSQFSWEKKKVKKQNINIFVYKRMSGWSNSKMLLAVIDDGSLLGVFCPAGSFCMLCWTLENDQYGLYPWACSPALWFLVSFSQGRAPGN